MTITGQNYSELTKIEAEGEIITITLIDGSDEYAYEFDPEGAIKVAHALIEAAEEIIKK